MSETSEESLANFNSIDQKPDEIKEIHTKARKEKPPDYPERYPVPDDKTHWDVPFEEYKPPYYVAEVVLKNDRTKNEKGWADPENHSLISKDLLSYEGPITFDDEGLPLNPRGRTGIRGRGLLGKWGANFAADPIITRVNPDTNRLEVLVIRRKDNGQTALPGGMVDRGEVVTKTLRREFREEAGADIDFEDAEKVYSGYVDDPRNTDNAWMETTACHKHLEGEAAKISFSAGDDATEVHWMEVTTEKIEGMYASHSRLVRSAVSSWQKRTSKRVMPDGSVVRS